MNAYTFTTKFNSESGKQIPRITNDAKIDYILYLNSRGESIDDVLALLGTIQLAWLVNNTDIDVVGYLIKAHQRGNISILDIESVYEGSCGSFKVFTDTVLSIDCEEIWDMFMKTKELYIQVANKGLDPLLNVISDVEEQINILYCLLTSPDRLRHVVDVFRGESSYFDYSLFLIGDITEKELVTQQCRQLINAFASQFGVDLNALYEALPEDIRKSSTFTSDV